MEEKESTKLNNLLCQLVQDTRDDERPLIFEDMLEITKLFEDHLNTQPQAENKSERSIGWLVEEIMKGSVEKNRNRQEQELIRRGEFRDRTERLVRNLMVEELDRAREEGRREVYEAIVFDKNIPHDVTTFVAANLWKNMRDKAKEELDKLTTK